MSIPILKTLRKYYPNTRLILLANEFARDLLEGQKFIDEIITVKFPWSTYDYSLKNIYKFIKTLLELRKRRIELAIDAQIDMRNTFSMFLAGAKRRLGYAITGGSSFLTDVPELSATYSNLLDARLSVLNYLDMESLDKSTKIDVDSNSVAQVETFLDKYNINRQKLVGIHPGASQKEKLWPSKNFVEIIKHLEKKGFQTILIEGPKERKIIEEIQEKLIKPIPCFKGNLRNALALLSKCRLLLSLDSAALHLANSVGTSVVAIYGPKWPDLTKPSADNIEIIWNENLECRPCEYGKCKFDTNICMESISPEEVISKLNTILNL